MKMGCLCSKMLINLNKIGLANNARIVLITKVGDKGNIPRAQLAIGSWEVEGS
jgi:hypothetical protein